MNTLKIAQRCPVLKGIYAGIARSYANEPENHIILLDAKTPNEFMTWEEATTWAESLGEDTSLPTQREAALVECTLAVELGNSGDAWTGKTNTRRIKAVKRVPVAYTAQ